MYNTHSHPPPGLSLVLTSGFNSWRAGRRVTVGRGEVEVAGVDSLFKVKRRVVFLQGLHVYSLECVCLPLPKQSQAECWLIVCMWSRRVLALCLLVYSVLDSCGVCDSGTQYPSMCVRGRRFCIGFQVVKVRVQWSRIPFSVSAAGQGVVYPLLLPCC